jgi:hypothetical protein
MKRLRTEDVRALELRCPKLCARDATHIKCQTAEHQIFRDFDDEEQRDILKRLLSVDIVILSLHTFFQDVYGLQACAASMRHLVRPGKLTIRRTLMASCRSMQDFSPEESPRPAPRTMDTAPGQAHGKTTLADEYRAGAMQELWAFMLRHYPDMPPPSSRTNKRRLAHPFLETSHAETVQRSAMLASRLGFMTPEIQRLTASGPDENSDGAAAAGTQTGTGTSMQLPGRQSWNWHSSTISHKLSICSVGYLYVLILMEAIVASCSILRSMTSAFRLKFLLLA